MLKFIVISFFGNNKQNVFLELRRLRVWDIWCDNECIWEVVEYIEFTGVGEFLDTVHEVGDWVGSRMM